MTSNLKPAQVTAGLMPTWKQKLHARGILDAALNAHWTEYRWIDTAGWGFPLYQASGAQWVLPKEAGVAAGRPAWRWKALDSSHRPKCLWGYPDQNSEREELRQPVGCQYYWLPGGKVKEAIAANDGALYIAGGEPDVLTLATVGKQNVTCFFGENIVPENLTEVLTQLGVRRVYYYPNNDNTGWDVAQKLYILFEDTAIKFDAYGLPLDYNDLNDVWRGVEFDTERFLHVIESAQPLKFLSEREVEQSQFTDNSAEWEKYHADIERALGATWKRQRGWSNPMACIFASHDHDDKTPSAAYHKEKHTYRCFKCGETWKGDAVADRLGIERPKPPQQLPLSGNHSTNGSTPHAAPAPSPIAIYSSDDSLKRYKERLRGVNPIEHVPFPFRALHPLGGFCKVVPLGKLIGVLGLSGGGKTSFIETLTDTWRQMGFNVLWWGPEWTWEEMADRAVQRWGGISMQDMMLHELWLSEDEQWVEMTKRLGVKQSDGAIAATERIADMIMGWEGKAYYLDKMDTTLGELLDAAQTRVDELAAAHRKPKIAVFDYIQLAEIAGARSDSERIPRAVSKIKAFCTDNRIVGVIGTQARKDDSEKARQDGELLTAEAAQYFRDDKTNLFITLNPEFDDNGNMTGAGHINVVKNSGGKRGKVGALPDPSRLRWKDSYSVEYDMEGKQVQP